MDELVRQVDRPQRRQQAPYLDRNLPGGRAEQRTGITLAPRHPIADRPRVFLRVPPLGQGQAGQRGRQRPAHRDQFRPARRDARPVRSSTGHPVPRRPALRNPVSGHRPYWRRHPEAGALQRIVDIGGPAPLPHRISRLEHHLSGPPGRSPSARQPHRNRSSHAEGGKHPRRQLVQVFRSDHAGDDNGTTLARPTGLPSPQRRSSWPGRCPYLRRRSRAAQCAPVGRSRARSAND
jgi:hypothetical protein